MVKVLPVAFWVITVCGQLGIKSFIGAYCFQIRVKLTQLSW